MGMKTGILVEAIPGGQTKSTIDACFRLQFSLCNENSNREFYLGQ